ncbi:MAG: glycosyltransferase family 39 protein [Terriglobales bacterium]
MCSWKGISITPLKSRKLLWIFATALALRLIVATVELPGHLNPRLDHFPFGYETGRVARAIALGQGFSNPFRGPTGPTALLPPVYTYLLAGVFKIFGIYTKASAMAILLLNSLFSALTCWPIYYAARRGFGERVALGAAWAWAFFPHAIYLSAYLIWDQNLTTLLLSLLFLAALHLETSTNFWAWAGFGLLWGLAALTNPIVLAVLPFLVGWICYRHRREGKMWFLPACAAGVMLIASLAPWMVRNYRDFHQFIPLRDGFWLEMYAGNTGANSDFKAEWAHPAGSPSEWQEYRRKGELGYIAGKHQLAVAYIKTHLEWFVITTLRRTCFVWTGIARLPGTRLSLDFDPDEPFSLLNILAYTTLTVLMLLGLLRAIRERNGAAVPYVLLLLALPLVYYITHPDLRFRHPMDPAAVILAVYAVTGGFALHRSEDEPAESREIRKRARTFVETEP